MGISTKCVCLTSNKNVFQVSKMIEQEIAALVRTYKNPKVRIDKNNMLQGMDLNATCEMIVLNFKIKGEQRNLHIHFSCDCDAPELGGKKIICTVGYWGESEEIIKACARALSSLGTVFVQYEDSSSEFEPWNEMKKVV